MADGVEPRRRAIASLEQIAWCVENAFPMQREKFLECCVLHEVKEVRNATAGCDDREELARIGARLRAGGDAEVHDGGPDPELQLHTADVFTVQFWKH